MDKFVGKLNETGNSKLCFHPNDSHRFEFSLFTVVLVHKYLQSKNGRNLGRSRDLRHGKCAIRWNKNQHAAYPFVTISLPLAFIVMSRYRPTQTCFQVPSLFLQGRESTLGNQVWRYYYFCWFVSRRQLMFSNILGIWKRLIKYSAILFVRECFMLKLSREIVRSSQPENAYMYIVSLGQLFLFCFLGYQQSLFFLSLSSEMRETQNWPRTWLKARAWPESSQ